MNPDKIKQKALGEQSFEKKVAEKVSNALDKRTYIDDPSEAPEGANVQEGERGGYYYDDGGSAERGSESYSYDFDGDLNDDEVEQLEDGINSAAENLEGEDVISVADDVQDAMEEGDEMAAEDAITEFADEFLDENSDLESDTSDLWFEAGSEFAREVVTPRVEEQLDGVEL